MRRRLVLIQAFALVLYGGFYFVGWLSSPTRLGSRHGNPGYNDLAWSCWGASLVVLFAGSLWAARESSWSKKLAVAVPGTVQLAASVCLGPSRAWWYRQPNQLAAGGSIGESPNVPKPSVRAPPVEA